MRQLLTKPFFPHTFDFRNRAADLVFGGDKLERGSVLLDWPNDWRPPWIEKNFLPGFVKIIEDIELKAPLRVLNDEAIIMSSDDRLMAFNNEWNARRVRDSYYLKERSFKIDSILINAVLGEKQEKAVYYLDDALTGCSYKSEPLEVASLDTKQFALMMIRSAEEYIAKTDFDEIVRGLPKLDTPLFPFYPVFLAPKKSDGERNSRELFDIFENVVIDANTICTKKITIDKGGIQAQFISQRYRKGKLAALDYPEIRVNGLIDQIRLIPKGVHIENEDSRTLRMDYLASGHLQVDLSKTKLVKSDDESEEYHFVDKYGNGIYIPVSTPWWSFLFGGKKVYSVVVQPKVPLVEASGSGFVPINIDLTPLGLGDYKNVFMVSPIPKVGMQDSQRAIYSACYYNGANLEEYEEYSKIHTQAGIVMAETMFDEKGIVKKLVLLKKLRGAFAIPHIQGVIFTDALDTLVWGTSFHETVHLIDIKHGLHKHPAIKKIVEGYLKENTRPAFCKMVDESFTAYCGEALRDKTSSWLNEYEFIAVLCQSVMEYDPQDGKIAGIANGELRRYANELKALLKAIEEQIPNGKDLPMSRKIGNLLSLVLSHTDR